MNKPLDRVGDVECRARPRCEPASQVARLRRKARPASLAIVIGSLLAVITLHTIWSNCSAESGVFFQLSDAVQPGQPTGGRGDGRASTADPSGEPVAGAVIAASYLAEQRDPSRETGARIVTPDTYRPTSGRSLPTTDRPEIGGAAFAPRVVPSRLVQTKADDDRYVQRLPEVVIASPESRRRVTTHTTYPAPSRMPLASIEFADKRRTTSQSEPRNSIPSPAHADSAATSDETLAEPAFSIRLADRPTRWKIEARPPVDGASEENVAAGIVAREQIAPPTDESAPSPNRISLRLRDDGADRTVNGVPQTATPEQDTRALPEGKKPPNDEANGSIPLRESLPIRWTIGGPKSASTNEIAQQNKNAGTETKGPASITATDVLNGSAPQTEIAKLRFAPRDHASSPAGVEIPQSTAPNRESSPGGWSTQGGDSSGKLRLVYEDNTGNDTSTPRAHQPAARPALRLVDEESVQTATMDGELQPQPSPLGSVSSTRPHERTRHRAENVPIVELDTSPPLEKQNSGVNVLSITSPPNDPIPDMLRQERVPTEPTAKVNESVSDLAEAGPSRDKEAELNAFSTVPRGSSLAVEKPDEAQQEIDGWVAVPTTQRQQPTEDPPPRPSMDFMAQKSPGVPPVDDSLAKRFTKKTIGWKVVRQKDKTSKLAVTDGDQPGQTSPEKPLDGDWPPAMSVAVKDPAQTSSGGSLIAKPSATERWKLDQTPGPSRLALRYATEEPEPPPGVPSRFLKDGIASDAATHDFAGTFGPRDLADVFALSRGEPVVPAARNDSLSTDPVENPVPFAFDDGEQPPTHPQTAVWRSPADASAAEVRGEERSTPSAASPGTTQLAIVRPNADMAASVESLPANSKTFESKEIPFAVAQAREGMASPAPDVDDNGAGAPASAPNATPKLLVHGLAAKPITQVSIDITPPVDDSPLGNEFPDEIRLPSDPTGEAPPIDESFTRGWAHSGYSWAATGLSHRPLYFEQVNLERHGYAPTRSRTGQSILAGAHFFGSALILPYRMGAEPMNECVYTLGHYRPGSYVPYRTERPPLDWKGGALETVTLMGLIFAIP